MELVIRRNSADARDVRLVREAAPYMLKSLLKAELFSQVVLHVSFAKLNKDLGDVSVGEAPRFRMRLHPEMDTVLMMVTLAHELVHVSQVMEGRLKLKKIKGLHSWTWDGCNYGVDPYGDSDLNPPWEIDAVSQESDLACQFFRWYVTSLNAS